MRNHLVIEFFIVITLCCLSVLSVTSTLFDSGFYNLELDSNIHFSIPNPKGGNPLLRATLSSSVFKTDRRYERCAHAPGESNICLQWSQFIVNITQKSEKTVTIQLAQPAEADEGITTCMEFGEAQWYEAAERYREEWPIQKKQMSETPFVSGYDIQSVLEPLWINSEGLSIYVSPETPLFVSYNDPSPNQICFTARESAPYKTPRNDTDMLISLTQTINPDPVEAFKDAVVNFLGKPNGYPEQSMFQYPIYSSWVRYKSNINQNILQDFAQQILDNGFPMGQFEIDDKWEPCYGAWQFDTQRFPDIKSLTDFVHNNGGKTTAWIYPFVNQDCNPAFDNALAEGRFIKNQAGDYSVNWWNGQGAMVDFTNKTTADWYVDKVNQLRQTSGLDSFKFDAGEASYVLEDAVLNVGNSLNPTLFSRSYVEAVSNFKGFMEVRVGRLSQEFPVFVRMLDKDSRWGIDNGLQSLIPSLFAISLAGYPFVLPDMIGGNAYGESASKELFIRWLQANTFMPALQFSIVPWDYDDETVEISKKYVKLHSDHIEDFMAAARDASENGNPINRPIWWIAPQDPDALRCNDEYLLGDSILVAPVVEEGATQRDIYLPEGAWTNEAGENFQGPTWLRAYPAPLSVLPYFKKNNV